MASGTGYIVFRFFDISHTHSFAYLTSEAVAPGANAHAVYQLTVKCQICTVAFLFCLPVFSSLHGSKFHLHDFVAGLDVISRYAYLQKQHYKKRYKLHSDNQLDEILEKPKRGDKNRRLFFLKLPSVFKICAVLIF
jgi:hypothetical protein